MTDLKERLYAQAEPVAWMYTKEGALDEYGQPKVILLDYDTPAAIADGWTETPLYPASALEAARREALEQAVEKLDGIYREMCGQHGADSGEAGAAFYARKTIYELKENPNAG